MANGIPCDVCKEPTWSRVVPKRGYVRHNQCADLAPIVHGTRKAYETCRCEICRSANNRAAREYRARRKAEGRPIRRKDIEYKDRSCDWCGVPLLSKGGAADGLSLCKKHRDEKAGRDRRSRARRQRLEALVAKSAVGTVSDSVWVVGVCAYCEERFTRRGMASPYCSKRCSSRDRSSSVFVTRRERLSVYERDGWVCQICFTDVDAGVDYLDDRFPSLDHVEPQSAALIPDHSLENLRTVHRLCNSYRGDGSRYSDEEVRRIVSSKWGDLRAS